MVIFVTSSTIYWTEMSTFMLINIWEFDHFISHVDDWMDYELNLQQKVHGSFT